MIRIGVLSDTHFRRAAAAADFVRRLEEGPFAGVDLVLHAGDLVDPDLLSLFSCRVLGVRGNMDPPSTDLPPRRVLTVEGQRIGLIHGWGDPEGLERRVLREFAQDAVDCVVFGHSHRPCCLWRQEILLFNPGSAMHGRGSQGETVGLLEIDEALEGHILPVPVGESGRGRPPEHCKPAGRMVKSS